MKVKKKVRKARKCQICNKEPVELYQLDFEGCFNCWMDRTTPMIYNS